MSALQSIIEQLRGQRRDLGSPYWIPGLWVDFESVAAQQHNPYDFYSQRLHDIATSAPQPLIQGAEGGDWTRYAITYNFLPRLTTAFDHNQSGQLEWVSNDGWRETGTLLKSIAILPYIRSMGFNTVHLLPVNSIGIDGRKGSLGSPYATRNPYTFDENLGEPAIPDVHLLFAGFCEAAHHLGLRVVMEFAFRIAAKDSDWVAEHPDWFYWIREDVPDRKTGARDTRSFGSPLWSGDTLGEIYWKVESGQRQHLPPPPISYQSMFTAAPRPDQVYKDGNRWIATLDDGIRVKIPGAFTDWPPEDVQQPWSDATYLRFYDHPEFNYMAYNTLRMYDERFANHENKIHELWNALIGVIPFYQDHFGIDGVMLDMGHALPVDLLQAIMQAARQKNPDFAFWGEDFGINEENRRRGYNAVMGYLFFDMHQPERMQGFIDSAARWSPGITYFIAPENHNTPRAATRMNALAFCHQALLYMVALPGMPFVSSGFELYETHPINTGLGFSAEAISKYPTHKLPLFSERALDWTRQGNLVGAVRYAMHLRQQYADLLTNADPQTVKPGSSNNPNILVFARTDHERTLAFVFNMTMYDHQSGEAELYASDSVAVGKWGFEGLSRLSERLSIHVELGGGHSMMFEATPSRQL